MCDDACINLNPSLSEMVKVKDIHKFIIYTSTNTSLMI